MRNKYPGICYICKGKVEKGDGYFERNGKGGWQVRHDYCESKHYLKDKNSKYSPSNIKNLIDKQ